MRGRRGDLDELRQRLTDDIEPLAERLFGAPHQATRHQLRFREDGRTAIELRRKRGRWHDDRDGVGGDPFELIAYVFGCRLIEAVVWGGRWVKQRQLQAWVVRPRRVAERARQLATPPIEGGK